MVRQQQVKSPFHQEKEFRQQLEDIQGKTRNSRFLYSNPRTCPTHTLLWLHPSDMKNQASSYLPLKIDLWQSVVILFVDNSWKADMRKWVLFHWKEEIKTDFIM